MRITAQSVANCKKCFTCLNELRCRKISSTALSSEEVFKANACAVTVITIVAEPRRIANRIVEEAMIAANICAARVLRDKLGFGIYNVTTYYTTVESRICWEAENALSPLLKKNNLKQSPRP